MDEANISQRVRSVQSPIIPTINSLVRDHPGTISLGQGVAYYGPPQQAYDAVSTQLHSPQLNGYGPVAGIAELTAALSSKLQQYNAVAIDQSNAVFVTAGSNMAFSSLIPAIADPGDEIILLTPYYFNHEMAVRLANATPILVPTLSNFHPDLNAIERAITPKTRAVVTISPNNPTGAVYTKEELTSINILCAKHGVYHISDEAYEDFVYEQHQHFSPASLQNASAYTISLYSFSKAYGFAGWRVGYMVIPSHLFASLNKIQDTILISPPIVSQIAALGALSAPGNYITNNLKEIEQSRIICLEQLNQSGLLREPATSEGAFYIFVKLNSNKDDFDITRQLITQFGIATIPGSAFEIGNGTCLRISYGALTSNTVADGMNRLLHGLKQLLA